MSNHKYYISFTLLGIAHAHTMASLPEDVLEVIDHPLVLATFQHSSIPLY